MPIPPGIVYLSKRLPKALVPPFFVYCLKSFTHHFFGLSLPTWLSALCYILSGPVALTAIVQYRDYIVRRDTAAHGAIVCPSIPGSTGGINMLFADPSEIYPGEPLAFHALHLGYTFSVRLFFQNRMITSEPENIKAILATEFNGFEKGSEFRNVMEPLLGTGVFAADGNTLLNKFHRQMARPFFHRERISDFDLFDRYAENAINQFKARLQEGYPADFQDMVSRFTMDAATSFLFNQDAHSLSAGLPYPFYATEKSTQSAAAAHPANLVEHMDVVRKFLDPILTEAVAKKWASRAGSNDSEKKDDLAEREVQEGETLLDHLVNYTEDHTILRDEILNISVAGRDTTASLLTFTIYMLAEHTNVLSKLRAEILSKVGALRRPTHDDFRELKYLRAKSLRLYSPVTAQQPTIFRSTNGDPPIYIPAGTKTPFGIIIMHRRTDLWGPDALEFDPDRFLDERLHKYCTCGNAVTPNPFIFLPFSAGVLISLSTLTPQSQFAYHEASFFLVCLLQTFSTISLAPEAQPPDSRPPASWAKEDKIGWKSREKIRPKSHLTLFVMGGLWVKMQEANPSEVV
ncbi:cytochrome P450 monooxygenase pc-2 [Mycena sp. CBHHK59/15]|nr:cytochrome P450 monooxygenase pc-2 [Mycena sp. CBHHK59/15]